VLEDLPHTEYSIVTVFDMSRKCSLTLSSAALESAGPERQRTEDAVKGQLRRLLRTLMHGATNSPVFDDRAQQRLPLQIDEILAR
jgi:hypothetical protein